jgi:hypothetical protein
MKLVGNHKILGRSRNEGEYHRRRLRIPRRCPCVMLRWASRWRWFPAHRRQVLCRMETLLVLPSFMCSFRFCLEMMPPISPSVAARWSVNAPSMA